MALGLGDHNIKKCGFAFPVLQPTGHMTLKTLPSFPTSVLLLFSHVWLFATLWTAACQASLFSPSPEVCPSSCSLYQWCYPTISFSDASSALDLSQHQGLFQWVVCAHQMTKILELQLQHQSFQWVFGVDFPWLISLLSKGLSGVFSSTTVWRHQFFGALPSLWSSSHNHTWPMGRPQPWLYGPSLAE